MKINFLALILYMLSSFYSQAQNIEEFICPNSGNSFRGISALSDSSVWVSSNQGQVWYFQLGRGWENRSPKNYETIQWRDIEAFNDSTALILSAGSPGLVLRTEDYGRTWVEAYRDDDPKIFFDAMDFWDTKRGVAFADAQDVHLGMIETKDGGRTWSKKDTSGSLLVWPQQGGFAASGTCIHCYGDSSWALILGGKEALFKFEDHQSKEEGLNGLKIPFMDFGAPSKGAFSLDFKSADTLIVVGGDYRADSLSEQSIAISYDGGQSWKAPDFPSELKSRYWSCVQWQGNQIILCSRFGTAISNDNGKSWEVLKNGFYSVDGLWFSGPDGRIGRL